MHIPHNDKDSYIVQLSLLFNFVIIGSLG